MNLKVDTWHTWGTDNSLVDWNYPNHSSGHNHSYSITTVVNVETDLKYKIMCREKEVMTKLSKLIDLRLHTKRVFLEILPDVEPFIYHPLKQMVIIFTTINENKFDELVGKLALLNISEAKVTYIILQDRKECWFTVDIDQ